MGIGEKKMNNKDFFDNLEENKNNKKVKCAICDKEFYMTNPNKGCPYCNSKKEDNTKDYDIILKEKNTIASVFKTIAWVTLGIGFIAGIILAQNDVYYGNGIIVLLVTWLISSGAFLGIYALGEIIQILHDIRLKVYSK